MTDVAMSGAGAIDTSVDANCQACTQPLIMSGGIITIARAWIAIVLGTAGLVTPLCQSAYASQSETLESEQVLDVRNFGAKGDARTFRDGYIAGGSKKFSSGLATFEATDLGKTIQIDGARGANLPPLVTKITSYSDPHHITVMESASVSVSNASWLYASDDSVAFAKAIHQAGVEWANGRRLLVRVSAGSYFINLIPLPTFAGFGGGVSGDGHNVTNIIVGADYAGDIFSWTDAWLEKSAPFNGSMADSTHQASGARVTGISIFGDRMSANQQNAFVFYDRSDFVYFNDVDVQYLNGRGLYVGVGKNSGVGYMTESTFDRMRFFNVGNSSSPTVEFTAQGLVSAATGEIEIEQMNIYAPYSQGMVLRAAGPNETINNFRISQLRIEGLEHNAASSRGDLLQIGDATFAGASPRGLSFDQIELLDPYQNYCAVRFESVTPALAPYSIVMNNLMIGGGTADGCGINVQSGRNLFFHIFQMNSISANVILGPSPKVGANIVIDGTGMEQLYTYDVHPTSIKSIVFPSLRAR